MKEFYDYLKAVDAARQENIRENIRKLTEPEAKLEGVDALESVLKKIQRAISAWVVK